MAEIDFTSAKTKKRKLESAIAGSTPEQVKATPLSCPPVRPKSDVYNKFFEALHKNFSKSAVLITKERHYKEFIPKSATDALPKPVMDYKTTPSEKLTLSELKMVCADFKLEDLTSTHISVVERETRTQSSSRIWYRQRAGRITASKLKQVVRTNPEKPAKSLIKSICYPEAHRFSSVATRYKIIIIIYNLKVPTKHF